MNNPKEEVSNPEEPYFATNKPTPEPTRQVTPEPTRQPNQERTPQPNQERTPQPNQERTPEPNRERTQRARREATPEPNREGTRQPNRETPDDAVHNSVHKTIRVRGARSHNLKGVDVDIPKRALTVFVGLSGSGKSSLAFDTIAAESRRLINETYSAFLQGFMPSLTRPEVDEIEGLTAAVVVTQDPIGTNSRSTVGTATDAYTLLRLLFSRESTPHVGSSACFSFNRPEGMCLECEGIGQVSSLDEDALVDKELSLNAGAIVVPNFRVGSWYWRTYAESEKLDPDKPLCDYDQEEWDWLMHAGAEKVRIAGTNTTYEGLVPKVRRVFLDKASEVKQRHIREFISRIAIFTRCPECEGTRLNKLARTAALNGATIAECSAMQVTDLTRWLEHIDASSVEPLVAKLRDMLTALNHVGLGYLSLDRETPTLSGGEAQRVKIVRHLGSPLTDITYVFDEPTSGLHPHDIDRMIALLLQLRDKGNTVLVVEHKPAVIAAADHIIELEPGAGRSGGTVTYAGTVKGLLSSDTYTARAITERAITERADHSQKVRRATGFFPIRNVTAHNLKDVSVDIPSGVLTVITGVAGSGKTSLINSGLDKQPGVLTVDQSPLRGSRRSTSATYTGLLDPIRTAFAKANGVKASLFSANSDGACPTCQGLGIIYSDVAMMADVETVCVTCSGRRYKAEVLSYRLNGLAIDEVLALTTTEARDLFTTGKAADILDQLLDVGLPYLTLGQPVSTLSGGERQRLKLASSMRDGASVYVLDEPTSSIHLSDTATVIDMLHRLVDNEHSVIAIEHNLAVMAAGDWIIDIGPGAGKEGGSVVFEGTPQDMIATADTLTAVHLRNWANTHGL